MFKEEAFWLFKEEAGAELDAGELEAPCGHQLGLAPPRKDEGFIVDKRSDENHEPEIQLEDGAAEQEPARVSLPGTGHSRAPPSFPRSCCPETPKGPLWELV